MMQIQLIRNATIRLTFAQRTILIDPDLAALGARPALAGQAANPMVELPLPLDAISAGVDALLVSHLHRDHFDAVDGLPRALLVLCQPGDEARIAERGFTQVQPVIDELLWQGIQINRTGGQHGVGTVGEQMGHVSGFVFRAPGEPTLYWAGDTIHCPVVSAAIAHFQPAVIVTHSSGARWPDEHGERQLIVMDAAQTIAVCTEAPASIVVATHMEALDHATITRAHLRAAADAAGISREQLRIPGDGEEMSFEL